MTDGEKRYAVTYNGEIYNYLEVRQELRRRGVQFRTRSDTEVILEAYKAWGAECVQRFNGMFALALYDSVRRKLFCVRDRYGEKPFLYHFGSDSFAFASEYKALLRWPGLEIEPDEWRFVHAAYNQSTGLDADRETAFRGIQQLLPGEAMEVDVRTLSHRTWKYWQIVSSSADAKSAEAELTQSFRQLLTDSIRLRMRSDVTVGSCLSGGLDSSAIVCVASKLAGSDVPYQTFTGRFPGTPADEWHFAREVVASTGVVSHVVEPTADGFLEDVADFTWFNELPVGSSSQYAQWCVFRLAKEHGVTVLLDGQGADELLGGYEQYFEKYVMSLREQGDWVRLEQELPAIRRRYPRALIPPARALRDRLPFRVRHWVSNRFSLGTSLLFGLKPEVAEKAVTQARAPRRREFSALHDALEADSFGRYLTTLLRYGDRNSMAHSREVRLPFCDHRLAEFVFQLPPHMIMGNAQTKRLLRESMRGILPESIAARWNKQGFRPPQDLWFASSRFRSFVGDMLTSQTFRESPFWNPPWWEAALRRVDRGELALGWAIWHPLQIEVWRHYFLDRVRRDARMSAAAA
jgi:asparagine synthase (glutamine-hydrolysing)